MTAPGAGASGLPLRPAMSNARDSDDAMSPKSPKGMSWESINSLPGICA
jgi:hypothetical protein